MVNSWKERSLSGSMGRPFYMPQHQQGIDAPGGEQVADQADQGHAGDFEVRRNMGEQGKQEQYTEGDQTGESHGGAGLHGGICVIARRTFLPEHAHGEQDIGIQGVSYQHEQGGKGREGERDAEEAHGAQRDDDIAECADDDG